MSDLNNCTSHEKQIISGKALIFGEPSIVIICITQETKHLL